MPLVPMSRLLADARRGRYAVCYAESWNLESLQAVVQAAEELHSPIIAGFNGGFLMHSGRTKPENLAYYAGMGLALKKTPVPAAFLLNETDDLGQIEQGMEMGFNAVMVENERLSLDEYRELVKRVVQKARARNVSVEAQVGHLPFGGEGPRSSGELTDPSVARQFVKETGVDALGVSVGNVHVLTRDTASIDLEALRRIAAHIEIPLVLHGGSGFPPKMAGEVVALGVGKFNFGTVLKQAYLGALRASLEEYREPQNPHIFLGMGGEKDVLVAGREAVKLKVKQLIRMCGSERKARVSEAGSGGTNP